MNYIYLVITQSDYNLITIEKSRQCLRFPIAKNSNVDRLVSG